MDKSSEPFAWVDWMVSEREKQGMTQANLARKAGLSRTTISDYEKRIRPKPDLSALMGIASALGYPRDHLVRMVGKIPDGPEYDAWVEKASMKLQKLSPRFRDIADRLIDSLIEEESANEKARSKPKPKSAKA